MVCKNIAEILTNHMTFELELIDGTISTSAAA